MCESLVGALSKIDREVIGAAMESVILDGATRLGRGSAILSNARGPFSNFLQSTAESLGNTICMYLSAFQTN